MSIEQSYWIKLFSANLKVIFTFKKFTNNMYLLWKNWESQGQKSVFYSLPKINNYKYLSFYIFLKTESGIFVYIRI